MHAGTLSVKTAGVSTRTFVLLAFNSSCHFKHQPVLSHFLLVDYGQSNWPVVWWSEGGIKISPKGIWPIHNGMTIYPWNMNQYT